MNRPRPAALRGRFARLEAALRPTRGISPWTVADLLRVTPDPDRDRLAASLWELTLLDERHGTLTDDETNRAHVLAREAYPVFVAARRRLREAGRGPDARSASRALDA